MERSEGTCVGKFLWIWGIYALLMVVLSNVMSDAGFSRGVIWAVAGAIGIAILLRTLEI